LILFCAVAVVAYALWADLDWSALQLAVGALLALASGREVILPEIWRDLLYDVGQIGAEGGPKPLEAPALSVYAVGF
jgi:hypothetical protein